MKYSALFLALLFNSADAIRTTTQIIPKHNGMISIELAETEYVPDRIKTIMNSSTGKEFNKSLNDAFDGKYTSLIQKQNLVQMMAQNEKHGVQEIEMDNLHNLGYEGKFWFGHPSQEMKVIFDTGSGTAWLFSEKCKTGQCPEKNKKYEQSKSTDFVTNEHAGQFLQYGKGKIAGMPSQDRICFSPGDDNCIDKFSFLTVVKAKDVESLQGSGLIGLSPSPAKTKELEDPMHNGVPSFIAQLRNSAKFNENFQSIFSIYLSNKEEVKGQMTFGGYDLAKFAKAGSTDKDIKWVEQSRNEEYWASNLKGVTLGDTTIDAGFQNAIFDNGMSFAMAPQESFIALVKALHDKHNITCQEMKPLWVCAVPSEVNYAQLPSLEFNLIKNEAGESVKVVMPASAYLKKEKSATAIDKKTGQKLSVARLGMTPWEFKGLGGKPGEEYWVLGAQFLQNYYTMYDFKLKKIGLIESSSSTIGKPVEEEKEEVATEAAPAAEEANQADQAAQVKRKSHKK